MNILKSNKVTYGGWIQTGSPYIAEIMAITNKFDWICIDLEHGVMSSVESLTGMIAMLELHHILPVVRVPKNDHKWIGRSLDAGAKGIIVPMVNSKVDAQTAVDAVRYPPNGKRGFGYSRSNGFGKDFWESIENANDDIALIVQIEHEHAMDNLNDILSVDGVDGSLIGPLDLKGSVDINMADVLFKNWIDKYVKTCGNVNSPAGIHIVEPSIKNIVEAITSGYKNIAVGTDAVLLEQKIGDLL